MSLKKTFGWSAVGAAVGFVAFPVMGALTGQSIEGAEKLNLGMSAFGALIFGLMAKDEAPASAPAHEPH